MSNAKHVFTKPVDHTPAHVAGAEAVSKLIVHWKAIVGFLAALVLVGFGAARWEASHANKSDVSVVVGNVAAVEKRVTLVEQRTQDMLQILNRMDAQIFEIAKATGAKTITQP
jgi:hypothetical protein